MKVGVIIDDARRRSRQHLLNNPLNRTGRQLRIETRDRRTQTPDQDDVAPAVALGRVTPGTEFRAVRDLPTKLTEPLERGLLRVRVLLEIGRRHVDGAPVDIALETRI